MSVAIFSLILSVTIFYGLNGYITLLISSWKVLGMSSPIHPTLLCNAPFRVKDHLNSSILFVHKISVQFDLWLTCKWSNLKSIWGQNMSVSPVIIYANYIKNVNMYKAVNRWVARKYPCFSISIWIFQIRFLYIFISV